MERNLQQEKRVPSTVYWRRRIVLLTIVGVLLWLITGWLFGEDPATRGAARSDAGGGGGQVGDGSRTAARAASGSSSKSGSSKGDDEDEGRNAARTDGQGDDAKQAGQGDDAKQDAAKRDASKSAAARGATTSEKTRRTPNSPDTAKSGAAKSGTGKSGTGKSGTGKPALPRCATDAMTVTARPAQAKARAGKPVPIELTVENSGERPCRVPPRQDEIRVVVMAGSDRVTDTARCPAPTNVEKQRVKPGKSTVATVQWNGRRDTTDCSAAAPTAKPGTYTVQASVFGALSEPTDFELR